MQSDHIYPIPRKKQFQKNDINIIHSLFFIARTFEGIFQQSAMSMPVNIKHAYRDHGWPVQRSPQISLQPLWQLQQQGPCYSKHHRTHHPCYLSCTIVIGQVLGVIEGSKVTASRVLHGYALQP